MRKGEAISYLILHSFDFSVRTIVTPFDRRSAARESGLELLAAPQGPYY